MSDQTANSPAPSGSRARRISRAEFAVYFGVIFVVALPFATLACAYQLVRHGRVPDCDPISRAWGEARAITPQIFLA